MGSFFWIIQVGLNKRKVEGEGQRRRFDDGTRGSESEI